MNSLLTRSCAALAILCVAYAAAAADPTGGAVETGSADQASAQTGEASDIENTRVFENDGGDEVATGPRAPYLELLKLAGSLAVVLGLVVGCAWAFRRFAPRTASGFASESLKVVARTYLGPRQMVCLVKAPGRVLVVGSTQNAIATLAEISDPVEVERILASLEKRSATSATETFRNLFASISRGGLREEGQLTAAVRDARERISSLSTKLEAFDREMN